MNQSFSWSYDVRVRGSAGIAGSTVVGDLPQKETVLDSDKSRQSPCVSSLLLCECM